MTASFQQKMNSAERRLKAQFASFLRSPNLYTAQTRQEIKAKLHAAVDEYDAAIADWQKDNERIGVRPR